MNHLVIGNSYWRSGRWDTDQGEMPVNIANTINTNLIDQLTALKPFKVNLTDDAKKGSRTMAEGREGLARLVSKIAMANIDSLARENDPVELEDKLAYDAKLEELRQTAMTILETVQEVQLANGIDIMKMVDAFSNNLQTSRSRNGSLDAAMGEVDEWNKRFVSQGNTTPNP
jgi:hypothetical protein